LLIGAIFFLKEIVVISDGSTDDTVSKIKAIDSDLVRVIEHKENRGKIVRLNEAFKTITADILLQFDADIVLPNMDIPAQMIQPFLNQPGLAMMCGWHKPLPARSLVGRMAVFGASAWEHAVELLGSSGDLYYSVGNIRAFSREFYERLEIPQASGAAEDLYTFFYAKQHSLPLVLAKDVYVQFRVPENLKDYIKQTKRSIRVQTDIKDLIDPQLVKRYMTMNARVKLKALIATAMRTNPVMVIGYLFLQQIPRFLALFGKEKTVWDMIESTKKV
jgi:glycosyltransferase involved in cell wall biosynthesis